MTDTFVSKNPLSSAQREHLLNCPEGQTQTKQIAADGGKFQILNEDIVSRKSDHTQGGANLVGCKTALDALENSISVWNNTSGSHRASITNSYRALGEAVKAAPGVLNSRGSLNMHNTGQGFDIVLPGAAGDSQLADFNAFLARRGFVNDLGNRDYLHYVYNGTGSPANAVVGAPSAMGVSMSPGAGRSPGATPTAISSEALAVPYQDFTHSQSTLAASQDFDNSYDLALYEDTGLDTQPWFQYRDADELVVGNSNTLAQNQIWFSIQLKESLPALLPVSRNDPDNPITVELNCSLSRMNIETRHVINKNPTRTGMHVTLWGAEPDMIQGSGSTGAWMNRFGLATWMSTTKMGMPSSIEDYIDQIFTQDSNRSVMPNMRSTQQITNGLELSTAVARANQAIDHQGTLNSDGVQGQPYRVAAQDMFAELLALFKYNAITRYKTDNYDGFFMGDREQLDSNTWSEKYGDSKYIAAARNNDVMRRGYVVMNTNRDTFLGFFKSLNFTEDTSKPYRWNFDFSFQVQKTIKTFAGSALTPSGNNTQPNYPTSGPMNEGGSW